VGSAHPQHHPLAPAHQRASLAQQANRLFDEGNRYYSQLGEDAQVLTIRRYIEGLELARKSGDTIAIGRGEFLVGAFHDNHAQPVLALQQYRKAYSIFSQTTDTCWLLNAIQGISIVHMKAGNPDSCAYYRRLANPLVGSCADAELTVRYLTSVRLDLEHPGKGAPASVPNRLERALAIIHQVEHQQHPDSALLFHLWLNYLISKAKLFEYHQQYAQAMAVRQELAQRLQTTDDNYRVQNFEGLALLAERIGNYPLAISYKDSVLMCAMRINGAEIAEARRISAEHQALAAKQERQRLEQESRTHSQLAWAFALAGGAVLLGLVITLRIAHLRKTALRRLTQSEGEKQVLLKELHHRVKNNLQMISSMLLIQASRLTDPQAKAAVEQSRRRVDSISAVHRNLYLGELKATLELGPFLKELAMNLTVGCSFPVKLEVGVAPESIAVQQDVAVPIGLIVNELITNSLKYAVHPEVGGSIAIHLKLDAPTGRATLVYSDDGVGMQVSDTTQTEGNFGVKLIGLMVTQLQGQLEQSGNQWAIRFPIAMPT
jgi:two-component sensor histidine kinase